MFIFIENFGIWYDLLKKMNSFQSYIPFVCNILLQRPKDIFVCNKKNGDNFTGSIGTEYNIVEPLRAEWEVVA